MLFHSEEEAFGSGDNGFGAEGGMVFNDANLVAYLNAPSVQPVDLLCRVISAEGARSVQVQ